MANLLRAIKLLDKVERFCHQSDMGSSIENRYTATKMMKMMMMMMMMMIELSLSYVVESSQEEDEASEGTEDEHHTASKQHDVA